MHLTIRYSINTKIKPRTISYTINYLNYHTKRINIYCICQLLIVNNYMAMAMAILKNLINNTRQLLH